MILRIAGVLGFLDAKVMNQHFQFELICLAMSDKPGWALDNIRKLYFYKVSLFFFNVKEMILTVMDKY